MVKQWPRESNDQTLLVLWLPHVFLNWTWQRGWCSWYFVLHFISLANLWFLNNLISIITEDCNIIRSYLAVWPLKLLLYVEKEMTSQDNVVLLAMDWACKQTTGVHIQHNWLMLFWWLQLLTSQKQCCHRSLLMKKWEIRLEMQAMWRMDLLQHHLAAILRFQSSQFNLTVCHELPYLIFS